MPTDAERLVATALAPLLATWPDEPMPPARLQAYTMVLSDLDPQLLSGAVAQCLTTCRFLPKPAEIRAAAFDLRGRAAGLPDPYEGWSSILEAIRVGAARPIAGEAYLTDETVARRRTALQAIHPLAVRAAFNIGGMPAISQSDNLAADRARFVDAFRELVARQMGDELMLPAVREHVKALSQRLGAERALVAPEDVEK